MIEQNKKKQNKNITTQPHSEGGRIFAYKGVGQLAYKGVPSCLTPLQASAKYHAFQPCFLAINPSNTTIFLDTFWIHFTYKGVAIFNPLISEKATPLRARLSDLYLLKSKIISIITQTTAFLSKYCCLCRIQFKNNNEEVIILKDSFQNGNARTSDMIDLIHLLRQKVYG
ncbi:Hypothetical_protein [Hexamita inflata]|uniref:Hypothetical_protein n=1 Tax=Hexamita inflata TaxID=28002 RepID=A0ABP1HWB8_9EUKA